MDSELNIFQLMLPLNYIFFGLVFLVIFLTRNDVRYVGWLAMAYIVTFVASLIEIFHAELNFSPLRFDDISNALYFIIGATCVIGIAKSEKVKPPYIFLSFMIVAGYVGQAYLAYVADSFFLRILFCDVIAAILFPRKAKKDIINRLVLWTFTLLIAVNIIRPAMGFFVLDPNISMITYAEDPYLIAFYFVGSILAIMMAIPLLAKVTSDIMETYRQESIMDPLTGLLNRRGIKKYSIKIRIINPKKVNAILLSNWTSIILNKLMIIMVIMWVI